MTALVPLQPISENNVKTMFLIVVDLSETDFEVRSQCLYCQMKYFVLLSFHNLGENWTEDVQDAFNVSGGEVNNILVHNNNMLNSCRQNISIVKLDILNLATKSCGM